MMSAPASRYCALNRLHDLRLRDVQHVEVPAQVPRMVRELRAAKRRFVQLLRLDHRAHGAVQNDDPLPQEILQRGDSCFSRSNDVSICLARKSLLTLAKIARHLMSAGPPTGRLPFVPML